MTARAIVAASWALAVCAACGGRETNPISVPDGGGGGDAGVPGVPAPVAAALPELGPCLPTHEERTFEGGARACLPPPTAAGCAEDAAQFVGDADCQPVGPACPAGEFADDLPSEGEILYVLPAATGTGTQAAPFGTIAEAIAAAAGREVIIALARGTFRERIRLEGTAVTLWGACPAETILTLPPTPAAQVLLVATPGHEVRNVSIGLSPPRSGVVMTAGGSLHLENVIVAHTGYTAIWINGAALTGRRVVLRDIIYNPTEMAGGRALDITAGSTVELTDVVIEQSEDIAVRATDETTRVTLEDVVIRDTDVNMRGELGSAVVLQRGAQGVVRRGLLERNRSAAVAALSGSTIELEDVVVRNTTRNELPEEQHGLALETDAESHAVLRRVVSFQNAGGVRVGGGTLEAEDVVIAETIPLAETVFGVGLGNSPGGTTTLRRVAVAGTPGAGLALLGDATISDVVVTGSHQDPMGTPGGAIAIGRANTVTAERVRIEGNSAIGILVAGASLTISDLLVERTDAALDGRGGRALEVNGGGQLTVTRALLRTNREVTLYSSGEGTRLTVQDLVIDGAEARACAETTCADAPAGVGLAAYAGAIAEVAGFEIHRASLCAVQIATGAQLELRDGVIADSSVGACVQVPDYDTSRLTEGVEFRNNEINMQFEDHDIPEPTELGTLLAP